MELRVPDQEVSYRSRDPLQQSRDSFSLYHAFTHTNTHLPSRIRLLEARPDADLENISSSSATPQPPGILSSEPPLKDDEGGETENVDMVGPDLFSINTL